jgi:hypothetical protein
MSLHKPFSQEGCTIFVKTGHLLEEPQRGAIAKEDGEVVINEKGLRV